MKWTRPILWIAGLFLVLFLVWPFAISRTPMGAMLTYLPVGWWLFLKRNIPQIGVNWGLIITGVICSSLVLVLGNWLLSFLYEQLQVRSRPGDPARKWRWRWSAGLYAALWLLFLIAFGATGLFRHTAWLLSYKQPWYERTGFDYEQLFEANLTMLHLVDDNKEDFEMTRKAVLEESTYWSVRNPISEDYNVILYGDASNKVSTYLIIPRHPKSLATAEFGVTGLPDGGRLFKPLSDLPQLLSNMDAKYPIKASQ
jgi:hypothetical protein